MNKEKVSKLIDQLENVIMQLKTELGLKVEVIKKFKKDRTKKIDLIQPIMTLLKEGFFREGKKDTDVITKLKEKFLMPKTLRRSSVNNTLRALFKKGLLSRKEIVEGNKKFFIYYEGENK